MLITICGLIERLSDVEMGSFDESVRAMIVSADSDVVYLVALREVIERLDEYGSVVCNYLA